MTNDYSTVQAWAETVYWSAIMALGFLAIPSLFKADWARRRSVIVAEGVAAVIGVAAFLTMLFAGLSG